MGCGAGTSPRHVGPRRARLEPVTAAGFAPYAPTAGRPTAADQRQRAAELLASTVRAAFGPHIDTDLRAVVEEGAPARVLLRHTRGALLLALGRTAHGRWELPAIGTVGRECLRHATVPVVTVPAPDRQPTPLRAGTSAVVRSGAA
ncbi:universal stress protein [Streptomyces sp. NBC_01092]|uniref:universal stress protein n=1 Tax=Streptomyces sp. NBC_01092 TaxID=2903748 RepID=UPI0038648C61|nr:universal stress protein [Streptomyces sp. NBC_01092]